MAALDFAPLFRTTVGFDRVPALLSLAMQREEGGYPPYNIEKVDEDAYRIVMAVAGFSLDDIEIITERNRLAVRGEVKDRSERMILHRGIAARAFERQFDLADFVEVVGASLDNGLLVIDLKRELPEALKPRRIEINTAELSKASEPAKLSSVA
jgi:molecular chaperone IbpA